MWQQRMNTMNLWRTGKEPISWELSHANDSCESRWWRLTVSVTSRSIRGKTESLAINWFYIFKRRIQTISFGALTNRHYYWHVEGRVNPEQSEWMTSHVVQKRPCHALSQVRCSFEWRRDGAPAVVCEELDLGEICLLWTGEKVEQDVCGALYSLP